MSAFFKLSPAWRYTILGIAAVAVVLLLGFAWIVLGPGPTDFARGSRIALADYHGADPTGVPPELHSASLVARGEYLAQAADCTSCHTAKGGVPFAGGLPIVLPFGTIYTPNITPDKETGIGGWSDAAFLGAIHKGIDDEGQHLYPAMPYVSYTGMTDADALAIKAYLFSLKPVHADVPGNTFVFPFNQRWLMGVWSFLFNPDKRFAPDPAQSPQWNRGAYIAENLEHCGECHTPRTLFQSLDNRRKFAGALQAGWRAYNISSDADSGVGAWSDAALADYLSSGHAEGHGTAGGPMAEAVDNSLSHLSPGDIAAIVAYLRSVPPIASSDLPAPKTSPAPVSHKQGLVADYDPRGKQIFEGACASCHDWTGVSPVVAAATLTGARAVNDRTAINVAQVVLNGEARQTPHGQVFMPAFGSAYTNQEIAAVANYVTARFGAQPSSITARDIAKLRQEN
ncbi:MAG: cytochrome c [Rhizomicrobium sp.]